MFKKKKKAIRVLNIDGEIGAGSKPFEKRASQLEILDKLRELSEDKKIDGVLLRIDSPGGAAASSEEIYRAVSRLSDSVPVYVSVGNLCCSGGYMIACGADKIFANASSIVGSIGVILQIPNITKLKDKLGIEMVTIKSGRLKDIGNAFRSMTDEERAVLQNLSDSCRQDFYDIVVNSRFAEADEEKLSKAAAVMDGRLWDSRQALELGFIDAIGDYDAALSALCKEIGAESISDVKLIYDKKKTGILTKLLGTSLAEGLSMAITSGITRALKNKISLH